jgi:hypothetical protein
MKMIKKNLKIMAQELREMKQERSAGMRAGKYMGGLQWTIETKKEEYRYIHIAYSMIRGREYKEIENKIRYENGISQAKLQGCIQRMRTELALRAPAMEAEHA